MSAQGGATKVLVLSDTHGNLELLEAVSSRFEECDLVLHLGDGLRDMQSYLPRLGDKFLPVKGNCDAFSNTRDEHVAEIGGVRIFLTHGHRYNVKKTLVNLGYEAVLHRCALALYGHTHLADITEFGGVTMFNPGCMSRSVSGTYSYGYLLIHGGKCYPKIVEIE